MQYETDLSVDERCAETVLECAKIIGRAPEPKQTIEAILGLIADRLRLEKGRVLLHDDVADGLRIRFNHGLSDDELKRGSYSIGEGITGRVMSTGQLAIVPDIDADPTYLGRVSARETLPAGKVAYIAVPILQHDNVIGVLAAHPRHPDTSKLKKSLYVMQVCGAMIGQVLQIEGLVKQRTASLASECEELKESLRSAGQVYGILGQSDPLRQAVGKALRASKSSATVLMVGESGCGKERFARMIHLASNRRDSPFVCINCAAIPQELLESELFGHEKGSFTGATASRTGKFEQANRGTLFLDEIGDMSVDLQAKLLRALQEKKVTRLGGTAEIDTDVRIVAATNCDLEEAVKQGRFRLDLYFRLNVLQIHLPPLRERTGDIKLLALYFLNRENQRYCRNTSLTAKALDRLASYNWPGNVRQLENVIERAVIMLDSDRILAEDIDGIMEQEPDIGVDKLPRQLVPAMLNGNGGAGQTNWDGAARPYQRVSDDDREAIETALRKARGNKTQAAKVLGLSSRQLQYRLEKLGIA